MQLKPYNKIFISVDDIFQEEITTKSGIKFYLDPTYSKEWNCTCVGVVEELPDYVKEENKDKLSKINKGDKIMFSYRVISDVEFKSDKKQFIDVSPTDSQTYRQYSSPQGESIFIRMLQSPKGDKVWVAVHQDKKGNLIDGIQGNESHIDRWLSNYSLGKTDIYSFRNLINFDGREMWKVEFMDIFAKKVDNEWVSISDRVLMQPIDVDITEQISKLNNVELPPSSIKTRFYDRALVFSGGEEIGVKRNEIASFDERYLEKYDIEGRQIFMMKKRRINAKWVEPKIITNV
jgi:hypothetical protein